VVVTKILNPPRRIGNSVKETNYYGPDKHHTIFEDNAENGEFMGTMLKLLKSSANAAGQILLSKDIVGKLIDFDKTQEQTMQEFGKLIDSKIKIYDYAEELMRYPSFDEFYTPVLKHLLQTDENGKLRISKDLVKNEIKNLLNLLIKDPDDSLASLAIELSTAPVLQAMFGEILSTKPSSELIKLPTSLLKIVYAKFEKEIDSFENNLNVLELIAKEGSKSGLKKLVKLITKKLVTNGKESEAVSLIKQLHYCNKANCNVEWILRKNEKEEYANKAIVSQLYVMLKKYQDVDYVKLHIDLPMALQSLNYIAGYLNNKSNKEEERQVVDEWLNEPNHYRFNEVIVY